MRLAIPQFAMPILVTVALGATPTLAQAGGAFLAKGGAMRLTDDAQQLDLQTRNLDESSAGTLGFSWELRRKGGATFGIEFLTYRNSFTPPFGEPGEAKTWAVQFLGKKYFIDGGPFHPFFGAGLGPGRTRVSYHNAGVEFSDEEFTLVLQAVLGMELRFDNLAFSLEAKHLYHDVESGGNEYDPTANGVFAGVGFTW
jgi:hypothetical protein